MVENMEDRKGADTKERLYNLNKEWANKKEQKLADEAKERKQASEQSFNQSQRDKPREQPLIDSLYGDAEARRTKLAQKQQEHDKTRGLPKDSKYVNDKMDKYVMSKFDKEFNEVVQEVVAMDDDEEKEGHQDQEDEEAFNFKKLMITLQELSFLPANVVEGS
jgi:hypothetical protein